MTQQNQERTETEATEAQKEAEAHLAFQVQPGEGALFLTIALALPAEELEHVHALQDRTEESPDLEYGDRSEEKEEFIRLLSTALLRGVPPVHPLRLNRNDRSGALLKRGGRTSGDAVPSPLP